jgi:hypothetical protein
VARGVRVGPHRSAIGVVFHCHAVEV